MYTYGDIYRKADGEMLMMGISIRGWNLTSIMMDAKRKLEEKGLNVDDFFIIAFDNNNHRISKPWHLVDGKTRRYTGVREVVEFVEGVGHVNKFVPR